jgi:hypothetical protein
MEPWSNDAAKEQAKVWKPSPLSLSEKLEFFYLSPYYLQAAFFLLGTIAWLLSETVFRARLPFWTSIWGWSLVLTNLLSLPLMNSVGLFLEEAEERDFAGILSFILLSYILVPFQAYASIKGFIEPEEGPWFRTPKTGRITDVLTRGRFYRFIRGIFPGRVPAFAQELRRGKPALARMGADLGRLAPIPALATSTANQTFSGFTIRRRHARWVGKTLLSLMLLLSTTLASLAPGVPVTQIQMPDNTGVILAPEGNEQSYNESDRSLFSSLVDEVYAVEDTLIHPVKSLRSHGASADEELMSADDSKSAHFTLDFPTPGVKEIPTPGVKASEVSSRDNRVEQRVGGIQLTGEKESFSAFETPSFSINEQKNLISRIVSKIKSIIFGLFGKSLPSFKDQIQVSLVYAEGGEISVLLEEKEDGSLDLVVDNPEMLKPGQYTLEIRKSPDAARMQAASLHDRDDSSDENSLSELSSTEKEQGEVILKQDSIPINQSILRERLRRYKWRCWIQEEKLSAMRDWN